MKLIVIILIDLVFASVGLSRDCIRVQKYHYWRPYYGVIPIDAVLAGTDANGRNIYIAKVIHQDTFLTVPAPIKNGDREVGYVWKNGVFEKITRFIEVLCIKDLSKLCWTRVRKSLTCATCRCCFVQTGTPTYPYKHIFNIGRATRNGHTLIGSLFEEDDWRGLHYVNGTRMERILENFEVLSYDCNTDFC